MVIPYAWAPGDDRSQWRNRPGVFIGSVFFVAKTRNLNYDN